MKNIVHGMWIGPKLSATELITIYSFLEHNCEFHLWHYGTFDMSLVPDGTVIENANKIIPQEQVFCYPKNGPINHYFGQGSYAGFSDIFRYKLLEEFGGWWTDMDITCLKEPKFSEEYVFRTHGRLPVVGNIMKCPPNSKLMQECYTLAVKEVTAKNDDWDKPIRILCDAIKKHELSQYIKSQIINEDYWYKINHLYEVANQLPDPNWYFIHWMNALSRGKKGCEKDSFFYSLMIKYGCENEFIKPHKWL